jgi:hypothetical protein
MFVAMVVVVMGQPGCSKDTDCKGERVCEAGRCMTPVVVQQAVVAPVDGGVIDAPPSPPPLPKRGDASEYPKVVRRAGETCVQSLTDEGVVREECRAIERRRIRTPASEEQALPPTPVGSRGEASETTQRSTFVADFGVTGSLGLLFASGVSAALPGFGLHAALGGRFSDSLGLFGVLDSSFEFANGLTFISVTAAPALRLGDGGHATVAFGPTFMSLSSRLGSVGSVGGTILVRGVFLVAGGFGLHAQLGLTFDASGVAIRFAFGFGGSVI